MKRLLVLPFLFVACTHITSDIQPGSADPAIRRMEREFVEAANAGDINGMMAIYGADSLLMPPNAPQFSGRGDIQKFWSGLLAAKPKVALHPAQVLESCDMATEIGTYDLTIGPRKDDGKYVVTWRRTNGEWRVVADIFNSNNPPQM